MIDLSIPKPAPKLQPSAKHWLEVGGIRLSEDDKAVLTSPRRWLDDDIITASQNLLSKQFTKVGGFQAPSLAQKFAMEPKTGEFVQVLNVSGNHWITISTIGCKPGSLRVYDSMHLKLSSFTKKVVADLMMTKDRAISVTYANVQWQSGGSDCGLFALAFATSLCEGHDPSAILYNQPQMRNHLFTCLVAGKITTFPHRPSSRRDKTESELIPVFCICRLPDNGGVMIQCSKCDEWYHRSCIRLPEKYLNNDQLSWCCSQCKRCR